MFIFLSLLKFFIQIDFKSSLCVKKKMALYSVVCIGNILLDYGLPFDLVSGILNHVQVLY